MRRLTIATPPDFSLQQTVVSHGWYVLQPYRWDAAAKVLHRAESFDGHGTFDLRIKHDGKLVVESDRDLAGVRDVLRSRLRRVFQLDVELSAFHAICARRRSHRAVAEGKFGRLLCSSTLFEDAVKIIATTNTAWRQTVRMVELLTTHCGETSPAGVKAFPNPEAVARTGEAALREHCRLGYRATYVMALASGIESGAIDLGAISHPAQSTEDLFRSYRTLPGIGPYGAAHLLAMDGRHDVIAVDTEFRAFVRREHFRGKEVSDGEMLARYARWGRWKYLAYWSELWMDLRDQLPGRPQ